MNNGQHGPYGMQGEKLVLRQSQRLIIVSLTAAWLIVIAGLTVNKYAPPYLDADVILNSIMSLQRVTLFYWGQNRLLNVLPVLVHPFRDPSWNLGAVLLITSLSFYGLVYVLSWLASSISSNSNIDRSTLALKVFVIVSSLTLLIFKPSAIYTMALAHIEYPGALLLLALAVFMLWRPRVGPLWSRGLGWTALFIAFGMNPSIIIPMVFLTLVFIRYDGIVRRSHVVFGLSSVLMFVLWFIIARLYGGPTYEGMNFARLATGWRKSLANIVSNIEPMALLSVILIFIIGSVAVAYLSKRNYLWNRQEWFFLVFGVLFSIVWFMMFSMSDWVARNRYHWRYFSIILFVAILLSAIFIRRLVENLDSRLSAVLVMLCAGIGLGLMYSEAKPFSGYQIFRQVDRLSKPGVGLYSGDYWKVWPSVMRDLMVGHESYGLTYRGEANARAANRFVARMIEHQGEAMVLCLAAKQKTCLQSVNAIVGRAFEAEVVDEANKGTTIVLRGR